ncbi:hypothetical protein [Tritonibacter mobilis]|uniref:hypothetical protein n=1 Tax=Tritonibacter mobilis TaxID=379347 RepID=UPI003A5C3442
MSIENILTHLSDEDNERFRQSISAIGKAFEAQTGVAVEPDAITGLSAVRDHVLSGGEVELDLASAMKELQDVPTVANKLIAAQVKVAEANRIAEDTKNMSRIERMNYARERGLDKPRQDTNDSLTMNEREALLSSLNPQRRIAVARQRGWI